MSASTMNGGKRARPKSPENSQEFDENACPNIAKKKRMCKDYEERQLRLDKQQVLEAIIEDAAQDDHYLEDSSDDSVLALDDKGMSPKKKRASSPLLSPVENTKFLSTPESKVGTLSFPSYKKIDNSKCHVNNLSDEMILSIFRWLPKTQLCKLALVCKRWRRVAYDDTLWNRLDLGGKTIHSRNLEHVLKRGVTALRLSSTSVHDPVIKATSSYLPPNYTSKLQFLDLTMSQISTEGLLELLQTCRQLKKLSLENCPVNQASCEQVGHNPNLEVLNMTSVSGLKSNGLEAILACCTKLTSLNLAWTAMDQETLNTLSVTLPKSIKHLNISGCRKNLTDDHVKKIVESCPDLIELDLSDCTNLTPITLDTVMSGLKLQHLSLSRCYNMSTSNFRLLESMYSLEYLELFGVLHDSVLANLTLELQSVSVNRFPFSTIARPTTGVRRTSVWGLRVRD